MPTRTECPANAAISTTWAPKTTSATPPIPGRERNASPPAGSDKQPTTTIARAARASDTSPRRSQRRFATWMGRGRHIVTTVIASTIQATTLPAPTQRPWPPNASTAAARLQAITAIAAARCARPSTRASGSPYQNHGASRPRCRAFSVSISYGSLPWSSQCTTSLGLVCS